MTQWHVYLLECADGSFYTGIAIDVGQRFAAHQAGKGARYTRSRKALRVLACAPVGSRSAATRAELAIKRLPKTKKLEAVRCLTQITNDALAVAGKNAAEKK